jgi:competence protein ComEA
MMKQLMLGLLSLIAVMQFAFAQVDVNKGDAAALDSVKGVGPAKSRLIIDERTKNGDYKDWADLQKRVKGIGAKSAAKLSAAGLLVNGQPFDGAAAPQPAGKQAKQAKQAKQTKADATPAVMK